MSKTCLAYCFDEACLSGLPDCISGWGGVGGGGWRGANIEFSHPMDSLTEMMNFVLPAFAGVMVFGI